MDAAESSLTMSSVNSELATNISEIGIDPNDGNSFSFRNVGSELSTDKDDHPRRFYSIHSSASPN